MSISGENFYELLKNLKRQKGIVFEPLSAHSNYETKVVNSYNMKLQRMNVAKNIFQDLSKMMLSIPSQELPPGVTKLQLKGILNQGKKSINKEIVRTKKFISILKSFNNR